MNYILRCMLCPNTTIIDISNFPNKEFYFICMWAAKMRNWAMSSGVDGHFICCEECYPKAFDLSKGGLVGFLRDEYKKYSRKCDKEPI